MGHVGHTPQYIYYFLKKYIYIKHLTGCNPYPTKYPTTYPTNFTVGYLLTDSHRRRLRLLFTCPGSNIRVPGHTRCASRSRVKQQSRNR